MLVLNFAHPFTPDQLADIEKLAGQGIDRVIAVKVQFDPQQPFIPQMETLLDGIQLSTKEWQTTPILVNLPSLNHITAMVMAELHGRLGYFPTIVRIRPIEGSTPVQFQVAEILNLQVVREQARRKR